IRPSKVARGIAVVAATKAGVNAVVRRMHRVARRVRVADALIDNSAILPEIDVVRNEADGAITKSEVRAPHVQAGEAAKAAGHVTVRLNGTVQSREDVGGHRIKALGTRAGRIAHANPRSRVAELRFALAEHERIARTIRDILHLLRKAFH